MKCEDWYGSDKGTSGSQITPLNVKKEDNRTRGRLPTCPVVQSLKHLPAESIRRWRSQEWPRLLRSQLERLRTRSKMDGKGSIGENMPQSILNRPYINGKRHEKNKTCINSGYWIHHFWSKNRIFILLRQMAWRDGKGHLAWPSFLRSVAPPSEYIEIHVHVAPQEIWVTHEVSLIGDNQ